MLQEAADMYQVPSVTMPADRAFAIKWFFATLLGSGFGFLLLFGPLGVLCIATGQYHLLRPYVRRPGSWPFLTIGGGVLFMLLLGLIELLVGGVSMDESFSVAELIFSVLTVALLGWCISVAQYLTLRHHLKRSHWWIVINTTLIPLIWSMPELSGMDFEGWMLGLISYALLSGVGMQWVLAGGPKSA